MVEAITIDEVDPALRPATLKNAGGPDLPLPLLRLAIRMLPVARVKGVDVASRRHDRVRVRVYSPRRRSGAGALLWIHGGGLMFGDARQDEALCASTAWELGVLVVSTNYRFAPEHPFPAALDDVYSSWTWMRSRAAELGIDPERIAVGGESAGAGLAAGLVQRIHDSTDPDPVAQWLFAPMLDDRTAADRTHDRRKHFVWNNAQNRKGWAAYLGHDSDSATERPYAVPARRTDVSGLPPAYIAWGDIELFAEEDAAYAAALAAAGVPVTRDVVTGAPHGFENWARTAGPAQELTARAQAWLAAALSNADHGCNATEPGSATS